jgi:peptidyl-tRNA hydrolase, PTH1 family
LKLIAGLGNPGEKYTNTRHNIGFLILDHIAGSLHLDYSLKSSSYEAACGSSGQNKFILLKPMTFMNRSGSAILKFMNDYKEEISDILIIVDDFNIPLGTIRVRKGGSDGGHNGIADIIEKFDTMEFPRMRIGIGLEEPVLKPDFIDFVLGDFTPDEMRIIKELMPQYEDCVISFIDYGILHTMNKFNKNFLDK